MILVEWWVNSSLKKSSNIWQEKISEYNRYVLLYYDFKMAQKATKEMYQKELKLKKILSELTIKIEKRKMVFDELISTRKEWNPEDLLKNI